MCLLEPLSCPLGMGDSTGLPTGTWIQASPLPSTELPCIEPSLNAKKFGRTLLMATRQVPSKDRDQQVSSSPVPLLCLNSL